jgi:Cu2+-exporting ATPase
MCCHGCYAVAQLIAGSGLGSFYRQRTRYNETPQPLPSKELEQYQVYDDPALASTFVKTNDNGTVDASLLLDGISCAACTWLIEHALSNTPGVSRAMVNLQQSRLDIQFDPNERKLSQIFARVDNLGYRPRPFQSTAAREQSVEQHRSDLRRLAVAGLGMMQVGMFAIALHAGDIQGIEDHYQALLRWVSLPVAGFVVMYSARSFFTAAWRHLKQGSLVMDLPVSIAIGLAFIASVWATFSGSGQVYFDSVVMFTFLLLLGRFLESSIRQREQFSWLDAESALPGAVMVLRDKQWVATPRIKVQARESILIKAGETVPVDGRIVEGRSAVREDTFNGEHLPRTVDVGDTIYAGTVNIEQTLVAQSLGDYRDSRLAALQRSVDVAQTVKPRLAQLADRIAAWFVGGILVTTSVTALVWYQIDPDKAFWIALAVLVISCPCALALATPAALTSAAGTLRRKGIIVRGENALDALSRCTHLIFDKTGTLTQGALSLAAVRPLGATSKEQLLSIAAALQRYSNHPVASAFEHIQASDHFTQADYRIGAGIEAHCGGLTYRMGSEKFCRELLASFPAMPDDEHYWIGLCTQDEALAWIGLSDAVRKEAPEVIRRARSAGLTLELLTGDSSALGLKLAHELGIESVSIGQTPQQKMAHVRELQRGGAVVTMVGDGLNDAPVLGTADASFAVAGATDLARSQADFVIVGGDLHQVTQTLEKARRCRRIVRQNLMWALSYNISAIPLAALGYIPPWAAAIGMSLSSLLVVANSLRLTK